MPIHLSPIEVRVLGALIEKESTTPEYYPLSLNALVNACNQKNNREPVMQLNEDEVRNALHRLQDRNLAAAVHDSRVTKYEHHLQEVFNLTRGETAILCILLLRGPQTPGELRGRTERMHRFEELGDLLSTLEKTSQYDPPVATALPRQSGSAKSATPTCSPASRTCRSCPRPPRTPRPHPGPPPTTTASRIWKPK
ncbi:MAG: YceH family protein [Acidobacteriaceae bacterium]